MRERGWLGGSVPRPVPSYGGAPQSKHCALQSNFARPWCPAPLSRDTHAPAASGYFTTRWAFRSTCALAVHLEVSPVHSEVSCRVGPGTPTWWYLTVLGHHGHSHGAVVHLEGRHALPSGSPCTSKDRAPQRKPADLGAPRRKSLRTSIEVLRTLKEAIAHPQVRTGALRHNGPSCNSLFDISLRDSGDRLNV